MERWLRRVVWLIADRPRTVAAAVGLMAAVGGMWLARRCSTAAEGAARRGFPSGRELHLLIAAAQARATAHKELLPLVTSEVSSRKQAGIPFVVSILCDAGLRQKPKGLADSSASASKLAAPVDAFAAVPPALRVCPLGPSHDLLLNKFPVIQHHCLVITTQFVPQDGLLSVEDLRTLFHLVSQVGGVGFYNSGPFSGASQPRRHTQFIPSAALDAWYPPEVMKTLLCRRATSGIPPLGGTAPVDGESFLVPMDVAIAAEREKQGYSHAPGTPFAATSLPFSHAVCMLGSDLASRGGGDEAPGVLWAYYVRLLQACGISTTEAEPPTAPSPPAALLAHQQQKLSFFGSFLTSVPPPSTVAAAPVEEARRRPSSSGRPSGTLSFLPRLSGGAHTSYNFVLTPKWMMVVPRCASAWRAPPSPTSPEERDTIHINALGFAGLLLARPQLHAALAASSPLEVLASVAAPPAEWGTALGAAEWGTALGADV